MQFLETLMTKMIDELSIIDILVLRPDFSWQTFRNTAPGKNFLQKFVKKLLPTNILEFLKNFPLRNLSFSMTNDLRVL